MKRSATIANPGSGEGKANRFSMYRKAPIFDKPEKTPTSSSRKEDTMEMEDDTSFGNSPRVKPETDMKQAVMNMHETQEVQ